MSKQEIATMHPEDALLEREADSVSDARIVIDGDRDKEAALLDPVAGAGSAADPSSGIPSAMTQHGIHGDALRDRKETPAPGHLTDLKQDTQP